MMADPAIGKNSSPDFGAYPNDAYFCVNSSKSIQYPITDADNDSLSYALVEPLGAWTTSNGTAAGSGGYPFYPSVFWQAGYSINNIIGGNPVMSINPSTGEIIASPSLIGYFTFAIRVEEFRDINGDGIKTKIGETRRDVQYSSTNCPTNNPPQYLNASPIMHETITINYNQKYCKDLIFRDLNSLDTIYLKIISPIFNEGAYFSNQTLDNNGNITYYYDWDGNSWSNSVTIPPNKYDNTTNTEWNLGTIATRFCWTPQCSEIGKTFSFKANFFSLGCDGKSQDSIVFNLAVIPPKGNLTVVPNIFTPNNDGINDIYEIGGFTNPCVDYVKVEIYNRWGELVYKSEEPNFQWDGKNKSGNTVPNGTYFLIIKGVYGEKEITKEKRIITLLR